MKKLIFPVLLCSSFWSYAQNNSTPSPKKDNEIKISGYLQTQFQIAEKPGISSFSGGDFDTNSDNRFMIRRGRIKIDREDKISYLSFQLDATQNGVALMDAYLQLNAPNYKQLVFTAGLFNRPFGYAVSYSSSNRDFPERPRVIQSLMPRERDLGAMISFSPDIFGKKFLELDFAVLNGTGISAKDYDSKKDYIGNIGFKFDSLLNNKVKLGFGTSIYKGTVRNNTSTIYTSTRNGFIANTSLSNVGYNANRQYTGANLQVEINNSFGKTTFKSEYLSGKQPGVASSESIKGPAASMSFSSQPKTDLYERKFNGYFFWLTQELGSSNLNALVSFDVYDPNTDVTDSEIGNINSNTTAADIKFSTLGYGLAYSINSKIKFTLYNEHVFNKSTKLENYQKDIKDNVFTARIQYRW